MTTTITEWPRIRRRRDGNYEIDCGVVDGRRRVYVRSSLAKAELLACDLRKNRVRIGDLAGTLTSRQVIEATSCFELMKGVPLRDAVDYYLAHHSEVVTIGRTLSSVIEELLKEKRACNQRQRSIETTASRLNTFAKSFGKDGGMINAFDDAVISEWMAMKSLTPATKISYLRELSALFNFAVRRGWCTKNPTEMIVRPRVERAANRILSIQEVRALMSSSELRMDEHFIIRLAIMLFAGVRPCEAGKLDRNSIGSSIHILPEVSKIRQERYVAVSDNLREWLNKYPSGNPCECKGFDEKRITLTKTLGIKWQPDITRKSFASYHLAAFDNAPLTAAMMGHVRGLEVLYRHYRVPVEKHVADEYWLVWPYTVGC